MWVSFFSSSIEVFESFSCNSSTGSSSLGSSGIGSGSGSLTGSSGSCWGSGSIIGSSCFFFSTTGAALGEKIKKTLNLMVYVKFIEVFEFYKTRFWFGDLEIPNIV